MQASPGGDTAVEGHAGDAAPDADRRRSWLVALSVVAALLPIVVATGRALGRGWIATGDEALIAQRAHDVFTHYTPLVGAWSSASLTSGIDLNHPGPLFFDALAIPERLFGVSAGSAIGTALVNCLAVLGIALIARRRGGAVLMAVAMGAAAALSWTMGSEVLLEPWQPHILVLPFLLFLLLVWAVSCGDLALVPWTAFVASFILETHLSYVLLVPVLMLWGLAGLGLELRRRRREDRDAWPALRRRTWRTAAVAGIVVFLCWLQPLIEQVTTKYGNFSRLLDSAQQTQGNVFGWKLATRLVATVLSVPPWWFRPSFSDSFLGSKGWTPPSLLVSALSLTVLAVALAACFWIARRAMDRISTRAIVTAVVACLVGLVSAERNPVGVIGIAPHVLRWLWPIAAFTTFAIVATVMRRLDPDGRRSSTVIGGFVLIAVVFGALNLPTANLSSGENSTQYSIPGIKGINRQLGVLDGKGPFLIDGFFDEIFDPYGSAFIPELAHRGFAFVVTAPGLVRQLGPERRFTGTNARTALFVRTGVAARLPLDGVKRVAYYDGFSSAHRRELNRLLADLTPYINEHGLQLNARGRAARAKGDLPLLDAQIKARALDVKELSSSGELELMVDSRDIVIDPDWRGRFLRYADLQVEWDQRTVAMYERPVAPSDRQRVSVLRVRQRGGRFGMARSTSFGTADPRRRL
jgi:hypothetical protein